MYNKINKRYKIYIILLVPKVDIYKLLEVFLCLSMYFSMILWCEDVFVRSCT